MLPQDECDDKEDVPRFLVDAMLGRLARWLRLMGYDTLYWRDGSDAELAEMARVQDRLLITRDRQLAGRRGVRALLVTSEMLDQQLAEVRAGLGVGPRPARCAVCNGLLQELTREAARPLVPAYVWCTQVEFRQCAGCGRVFWKGTHWPGVLDRLEGNGS